MTSLDDELATLRARAYGPAADLDAVSLLRLRELEAADRATRHRSSPESSIDSEGADARRERAGMESRDDTVLDDAVVDDIALRTSSAVDAAAPAARPIPVGWLVAWAASLLVVAIAVGAIVWSLASIRPVSDATGATQIDTIDDPVENPAWTRSWFTGRESEVVSYRYRGLLLVSTQAGVLFDDADCLLIIDEANVDETDGSVTGEVRNDCRAGMFPASVQFVVDESSPTALRERFADGTALGFVLDGGVIGVFGGADPTAPTTALVTP